MSNVRFSRQPRWGQALVATPALLIFAATAQAAEPAPTPLLAHRAVYDLTLGKADGANAPASARGRIVYEFSGAACEGYVTNFRQITEIQTDEGSSRVSDMRSSTFESGDGSNFRFKTDTLVDGRAIESVDGSAARSNDGAVSVNLRSPSIAKYDFASGAVFPTAQIQAIVAAAKAGEHAKEIPVYDGSEAGQKVFNTTAIIGPEANQPIAETIAADADALRGVKRWPVSISYFDAAKQDGAPNYTLAFDLYENGVSGKLRIDYGAYTLVGAMTKFELLPAQSCTK